MFSSEWRRRGRTFLRCVPLRVRGRTRHRNELESVTETLLFLIASLQLIPTIIPAPLVRNYKRDMIAAWVVAIIAFLGVRVRLR